MGDPAHSIYAIVFLAQTGSTSQKASLAINKGGDSAPNVGLDTVVIQTAMNVPDSKFGQVEFAKGSGENRVDANAVGIQTALAAPAPPRTINTIDKREAVRGNVAQ